MRSPYTHDMNDVLLEQIRRVVREELRAALRSDSPESRRAKVHVCDRCGQEWSGSHDCPGPASTGGERDDYRAGRPLEGGWTAERGVTCVVCPDCAFAFDAIHEDEPNGGYSCPCCHPPPPEGAVPVGVTNAKINDAGLWTAEVTCCRGGKPRMGEAYLLPRTHVDGVPATAEGNETKGENDG